MISGLRSLGVTIFLTTHFMDEAEHLADRLMVLAEGRIVAEGSPGTIGGRERAAAEIRFSLPDGADTNELPEAVRVALEDHDGDQVLLRTESPMSVLESLFSWARARGCDLTDLDVRRPSLEDVYLALTAPRDEGA
jgi:ABC-2 type transport system ATP-binding protein